MATFMVNYAIGGLKVEGYHYVNILIHIINAFLVYFFLFYTFKKVEAGELWSRTIAFSSALFFAVHPIQTQSVTYIVQRMESLASLFYLAALLFFIKGAEASRTVKRVILYSGVVFSYLLGFYSKQIAVTMPALILLYDFYFISRGKVKELSKRWPLYMVMLICLVLFIWKSLIPAGGFGDLSAASAGFNVRSVSSWEYLLTQCNVLVYTIFFFCLCLLNQNLDYDFPVSRGLFEMPQVEEGTVLNFILPPPVVSLVILLIIVGAAIYLYRRATYTDQPLLKVISFFIIWFFIILSPTSSFIPIIDVIFEHRVYLSSVGVIVVFMVVLYKGVERVGSKWQAGAINFCYLLIVIIVAVTLSVAAYKRNLVWSDEYTLWTDVVAKSPNKARPHNNLGLAYNAQQRIDDAIKEFQTAIEKEPNYAQAHNNLGGIYAKKKHIDRAIQGYLQALRIKPKFPEAHYNLGKAYADQGRIDEAIKEYLVALQQRPNYAGAHNNLGLVYVAKGRLNDAIREYQLALELEPEYVEAYNNLAISYLDSGKLSEALSTARAGLSIDRNSRDTINTLGEIYLKLGENDNALREFEKALLVEETAFRHWNAAIASERLHLVDKAITHWERYIALNPDGEDVEKVRKHLIGLSKKN